jgi:hypothetical protein
MSEDNFDIEEAKKCFRIRKALWEAERLKELEIKMRELENGREGR